MFKEMLWIIDLPAAHQPSARSFQNHLEGIVIDDGNRLKWFANLVLDNWVAPEVHRKFDIVCGDRASVVPFDILAKVESPRAAIGGMLPTLCQRWSRLSTLTSVGNQGKKYQKLGGIGGCWTQEPLVLHRREHSHSGTTGVGGILVFSAMEANKRNEGDTHKG
jgi:hypothetical protein